MRSGVVPEGDSLSVLLRARAQTDSSRYEEAHFVANHYEYCMYQQGPQPVRHLYSVLAHPMILWAGRLTQI